MSRDQGGSGGGDGGASLGRHTPARGRGSRQESSAGPPHGLPSAGLEAAVILGQKEGQHSLSGTFGHIGVTVCGDAFLQEAFQTATP